LAAWVLPVHVLKFTLWVRVFHVRTNSLPYCGQACCLYLWLVTQMCGVSYGEVARLEFEITDTLCLMRRVNTLLWLLKAASI
jgi:hypothetical protein